MRHSTGRPTKREEEYMRRCKEGHCVVCVAWLRSGKAPEGFEPCLHGDFDHKKSGNIRRGHMFGFCACKWHHERHPWEGWSTKQTRDWFGPSLKDGSRLFHLTYGSDDDLIALQHELIGWEDELEAD